MIEVGDKVRVPKSRDVPAALDDKIVPVVKVDELSVWVERDGAVFALARSQVKRIKP